MKREAVNENVRFAALEKKMTFFWIPKCEANQTWRKLSCGSPWSPPCGPRAPGEQTASPRCTSWSPSSRWWSRSSVWSAGQSWWQFRPSIWQTVDPSRTEKGRLRPKERLPGDCHCFNRIDLEVEGGSPRKHMGQSFDRGGQSLWAAGVERTRGSGGIWLSGQTCAATRSNIKSQKIGLSGLLHSPVDIIGEKVDHLTNSGLAKRAVGELQSLSADKMSGLH